MAEQSTHEYELFVSYAEADEGWVKGCLLKTLKDAGVRCIHESGFLLGAIKLKEFERAIKQSKRTLLVISPQYLGDGLDEFITLMAANHDLDKQTSSVIPLIYKDTSLPIRLGMLKGLRATTEKEQESALVQLLADLGRAVPGTEPLPKCPYPGMRPFTSEDSALFFGREDEIRKLVAQLEKHTFMTVIGPSGSGKSSLVLAGLIPALKQGQLRECREWQIKVKRPVEDLQASLEQVLAQGTKTGSNPLLFVVDQFEELFTVAKEKLQPCQESLLKLRFIPNVYVVLTVRSDFYTELMTSLLWSEIEDYRLEVVPLTGDKLRQAIKQPAENVEVFVDPALIQQLLTDASGEPGILPLIQETLRSSWKNLKRRFLPLSAYQELLTLGAGQQTGLQVAIALVADEALKNLKFEPEKQKAIARRIFLRLIQFGEGRPDTRRQQLQSSFGDRATLFEQTLQHLVDCRLLTLSGEESTKDKQIDIAHEALIAGWPRLGKWIDELREAEKIRRRLEVKVQDWIRLEKKGGLLDKVELVETQRWLSSPDAQDLGYGDLLQEFVNKSKQEIQKSKLLRRSGIAAILVSIVVAGGWTLYQNQKALLDSYNRWSGYVTLSGVDLKFLQERLEEADQYRYKGKAEKDSDPTKAKENWRRAMAYYRKINAESRKIISLTPDTEEKGNWQNLLTKSEDSIADIVDQFLLTELKELLDKKDFGSSVSGADWNRLGTNYKGAMQLTFQILRLSNDGIGADMNENGEIDSPFEAGVLPCKTLKEINRMWRKATKERCGWYTYTPSNDIDGYSMPDPLCDIEIKGTNLTQRIFDHVNYGGEQDVIARLHECKIR